MLPLVMLIGMSLVTKGIIVCNFSRSHVAVWLVGWVHCVFHMVPPLSSSTNQVNHVTHVLYVHPQKFMAISSSIVQNF